MVRLPQAHTYTIYTVGHKSLVSLYLPLWRNYFIVKSMALAMRKPYTRNGREGNGPTGYGFVARVFMVPLPKRTLRLPSAEST